MNCEKCSSPNPVDARSCKNCGASLARPDSAAGADGKIAAVVIWVVCALGMVIVFTSWAQYSASCVAGGTCGPLWAKLMFMGSILGFGLGGRLWTRR